MVRKGKMTRPGSDLGWGGFCFLAKEGVPTSFVGGLESVVAPLRAICTLTYPTYFTQVLRTLHASYKS